MKEGKIIFEKDGTKIDMDIFLCLCGEEMIFIGSAGCPHDSNYTYTYQCPVCKSIGMSDFSRPRSGFDRESLLKGKWKQI